MITTDIEGNEINVGDECWVSFANCQLYKIKIVKDTVATIHYLTQWKVDSKWNSRKKGDWSDKTYMHKTSNSFRNMLKCQ